MAIENEDLWLEIIRDMEGRRKLGLETYGVPVTSSEAIDWCSHLTEELYDSIVYARAFKTLVSKMQVRITELEEKLEVEKAANLDLGIELALLRSQVRTYIRGEAIL
jgi:hypothetical protein